VKNYFLFKSNDSVLLPQVHTNSYMKLIRPRCPDNCY
jgi:hypothetical protein